LHPHFVVMHIGYNGFQREPRQGAPKATFMPPTRNPHPPPLKGPPPLGGSPPLGGPPLPGGPQLPFKGLFPPPGGLPLP
jgi:basic salivary proline-rich protein 1/2